MKGVIRMPHCCLLVGILKEISKALGSTYKKPPYSAIIYLFSDVFHRLGMVL